MPTTTATAIRTCRILYYGPLNCGKRQNLARIQASLPPEHRLAVATSDPSRHIAFMLRNGNQGDWQVFVQAMDAGQEDPVRAGTAVPFDGIVFTCDSGAGSLDEGLSAMEGLKSYLDCWRLDVMAVPMVIQYNHRDGQGVLPVDRLESLLNPWGLLSFPAASGSGEGVRETLKAILSLTISHILQRDARAPSQPSHDLTIDPNPPVPGTTHADSWELRRAAPASGGEIPIKPAKPPLKHAAGPNHAALVIPVAVPRSALGPDGTGRIILEVQVVDD
ncbi:MAG TPA: hypothetical protein PLL30_13575 [Candidatus Krumholzibacteria bacterium]|nr:hypothetical protein [Candidatus Krumholzibacteria bacterium]HPD72794.1 hypothetical protein [Candidatus Krumholzibacteria bacterium]HRY40274.1 hypothetical protein [Candidatus Krumholzibacteria bacterium]